MSSEKLSVQQQYTTAAYSTFVECPENAVLYAEYHHYSFMKFLQPIVSAISNCRVLDLACGNGILGRKLWRVNNGISFKGCDLSSAMLSEARALTAAEGIPAESYEYLECNVLDLPSDIGTFDVVVSGYFFAHINSRTDLFAVFAVIAQRLCSGGTTCHIIPGVSDIPEGSATAALLPLGDGVIELYDFYWSRETYMEAASAAGLADVSIDLCEVSPAGAAAGLDASMFGALLLRARKP